MIAQKDIDRFLKKVDKSGDCWEWIAGKFDDNYGAFFFKGKQMVAHRFSWLLHNGKIPEGLLVCHRCDNKPCVNPDHLFLGTHKDNSQDSIKKGRWIKQKGELNNYSKLTEEQVLSIRKEYKLGNISQHKLARKYNVNQGTIWHIVNRETWRHI